MKLKLIFLILFIGSVSFGGYYYYQRNYVETLMLSEIIGSSNSPVENLIINLTDFDTGLTRHDIQQLKTNKDYWLTRIQKSDAIRDPGLKEQAETQLLADMMNDPILKKIGKGIFKFGSNASIELIKIIL